MNIKPLWRTAWAGPERPQPVSGFRRPPVCDPDVIAGQVHVLPAQRGEMGQETIGDVFRLA